LFVALRLLSLRRQMLGIALLLGLGFDGLASARQTFDYILSDPRTGALSPPSAPSPNGINFDLALDEIELIEEELNGQPMALGMRAPLMASLDMLRPTGLARERCRPQMRNLLRVGHGASPDGRPEVCRLSSFLRRIRMKEAPLRRRAGLQLRFRLDGPLARRAPGRYGPGPMFGPSSGAAPTAERRYSPPSHPAHYWFAYANQSQVRSPQGPAKAPMESSRPRAVKTAEGR